MSGDGKHADDKRVIVALDFPEREPAEALLAQLDPNECRVKIGKEMFTAVGPAWIEDIQDMGFEIFLDLKFHDIPNTVKGACHAAADLGVWMLNVHASGGRAMMEAARAGIETFTKPPKLIAVTVLTSLNQVALREIGLDVDPETQVLRLARLAQRSGMDGVVCSPLEVARLRAELGPDFLLVTPGVRPQGAALGDQSRVMTPGDAIRAGSDYLVIGRPITQASASGDEPADVLARIRHEIASSLS